MSDDEPKGDMTAREAGRLGGKKRAEALGPEGYAALGRKGGQTTKARHGSEFYRECGKKGGTANLAKNGTEFYSRIGKQGGSRVRELVAKAREQEAQGVLDREVSGDV